MKTLRWLFIAVLSLSILTVLQAQENNFEMLAVQAGERIQDSFEDGNISHLYAFNASAGDAVSIAMSQESDELDPFIVLLDSEGAVLAFDDDSGSPRLAALIDGFEIEDDGVYFVLASSRNYIEGTVTEVDSEQAYQLLVSGQTTPETVDDAEIVSLEVDTLTLGRDLEGESTVDNPVSFFYYEGQAGDDLNISIDTSGNFFSVLYVFAPDGSLLGIDPSSLSVTLEDDGIYTIIATDAAFYEANEDDGFFEGGDFSLRVDG